MIHLAMSKKIVPALHRALVASYFVHMQATNLGPGAGKTERSEAISNLPEKPRSANLAATGDVLDSLPEFDEEENAGHSPVISS